LIGPPGCGKTYFMDCLAGETGLPTIVFDQGRVMSKFQGESDRNLREVIKIIRAFGRCIVQVDEFEKQFAGAGGGGDLDSGVTKRVTSLWLRFMSEAENRKGVYIIGTCNSFHGIPSAYLRPGRWDTSPVFIDIPTEQEKKEIAKYHIEKNNLELPEDDSLDMHDYTGADIAAACKLAATMNVPLKKASEFIIPQTKTMEHEINELREWSKGNTVPATDLHFNGFVTAGAKKKKRSRRLKN